MGSKEGILLVLYAENASDNKVLYCCTFSVTSWIGIKEANDPALHPFNFWWHITNGKNSQFGMPACSLVDSVQENIL